MRNIRARMQNTFSVKVKWEMFGLDEENMKLFCF